MEMTKIIAHPSRYLLFRLSPPCQVEVESDPAKLISGDFKLWKLIKVPNLELLIFSFLEHRPWEVNSNHFCPTRSVRFVSTGSMNAIIVATKCGMLASKILISFYRSTKCNLCPSSRGQACQSQLELCKTSFRRLQVFALGFVEWIAQK